WRDIFRPSVPNGIGGVNARLKLRRFRISPGKGCGILLHGGGSAAYTVGMESALTPTSRAGNPTVEHGLSTLTEISAILSSSLDLSDVFQKMMQIISDKLNMHRGTLVLLDESTGRLRTEAAIGLTPSDIERGKYALGEGVTGTVVATGRARIIPDVRKDPDFLNRTGRLNEASGPETLSYICVPITIDGRPAGALSVD